MQPSSIELVASGLFFLAVVHTFLCSKFQQLANRYPEGSIQENLFHLLGEVEVVFGIWAGFLILIMAIMIGKIEAIQYFEGRNFTEPAFVFAVMAIAATRPIIHAARILIFSIARILPIGKESAVYISCLVVGPLLGSFITEPAAMTVTALILLKRYYATDVSDTFRYVTIATLFVNISIGGVLTPYAAPPVLMVAGKWGWDLQFMLLNFGWKAATAVILNTLLAAYLCRKDLQTTRVEAKNADEASPPWWLILAHGIALGFVVVLAHHPIVFIGVFLFFLGLVAITKEFQDEIKLRESLLVAFFLGGLVVLGGLQSWWLAPVLSSLGDLPLFLGATALTAITDNAALTFLGSQVEGISDSLKYSLVAGAVAGGGLTVIANAPNPAGYSILQSSFGGKGISPILLLWRAIPPTIIAMLCFWFLGSV
jgi:hypothetical protein